MELAICAATIGLLIYNKIPAWIITLIAANVLLIFNYITPNDLYKVIGSTTITILFSSMLFVQIISETGILERYAKFSISNSLTKDNPFMFILLFTLSCASLSAIIPNIPVALLFLVLASKIETDNINFKKCLYIMSALAPAVGGVCTPLGGVPNIIAIGLIQDLTNTQIEFLQWIPVGFIISIFGVIILSSSLWFLLVKNENIIFKNNIEKTKISLKEKISIVMLIITIILLAFGKNIFNYINMEQIASLCSPQFILLFMSSVLLLIPNKENNEWKPLVDYSSVIKNINYSILLYVIGALIISKVIMDSGVIDGIANIINTHITSINPILSIISLIIIGMALCQIFDNVALMSMLVPLCIATTQNMSLSIENTMIYIIVCIASNMGLVLPISSPVIASVLESSNGIITSKELLKFSLPIFITVLCISTIMIII